MPGRGPIRRGRGRPVDFDGDYGDSGWRFNISGNDDFWPEVGTHEGRSVMALLDQGMLGGVYDEDDVIHPPSIVIGVLSSDFLGEDEEDGEIFGWLIDTIDGRYDLGSVIVCWKWHDVA